MWLGVYITILLVTQWEGVRIFKGLWLITGKGGQEIIAGELKRQYNTAPALRQLTSAGSIKMTTHAVDIKGRHKLFPSLHVCLFGMRFVVPHTKTLSISLFLQSGYPVWLVLDKNILESMMQAKNSKELPYCGMPLFSSLPATATQRSLGKLTQGQQGLHNPCYPDLAKGLLTPRYILEIIQEHSVIYPEVH